MSQRELRLHVTELRSALRVLSLALLLSGCASSPDPWTTRDTWMQLGVTAVIAADAYTTAQIQHTPDVREKGIAKHFIGTQPTTSDTVLFFATWALVNHIITWQLPQEWRPYWQGLTITVHSAAVMNNCNLGLCKE